ncbi:hypothetical protein BIFDEN_00195 [Bifidobacterium dentium ATCC 27678]|nr:hypothetical protein BIFDEN_00195 [Bifidobacterium dentium ATCC 27678]
MEMPMFTSEASLDELEPELLLRELPQAVRGMSIAVAATAAMALVHLFMRFLSPMKLNLAISLP